MKKNTVVELVESARGAKLSRAGGGYELAQSLNRAEQERVIRHIAYGLVAMSLALGYLTIFFDGSWVIGSPLFRVAKSSSEVPGDRGKTTARTHTRAGEMKLVRRKKIWPREYIGYALSRRAGRTSFYRMEHVTARD